LCGENEARLLGPLVPSSLREAGRYTGMAPVRVIACRIDLGRLRATSATPSRVTKARQMLVLAAEGPLASSRLWSAPQVRAGVASAAAMGPLWSSSEPSPGTDTDRSERRVFSPKKSWKARPTGLLRKATPPPWPGECQE